MNNGTKPNESNKEEQINKKEEITEKINIVKPKIDLKISKNKEGPKKEKENTYVNIVLILKKLIFLNLNLN